MLRIRGPAPLAAALTQTSGKPDKGGQLGIAKRSDSAGGTFCGPLTGTVIGVAWRSGSYSQRLRGGRLAAVQAEGLVHRTVGHPQQHQLVIGSDHLVPGPGGDGGHVVGEQLKGLPAAH
jgi:hypothetical protein